MKRRSRRARHHVRYQLVLVTPSGRHRPLGAPVGTWAEAVTRCALLGETLRAEQEHGGARAGGAVWVIDAHNGTIVQTVPISAIEPSHG
jgi:hypothetical protein